MAAFPPLVEGPMAPELQALKRASAALVRAVGGLEAAENFCRLGKSQLSDCCSIHKPDRWLPIDVVRDLEAVTAGTANAPQVSRMLAGIAGHGLIELPGDGDVPADPLALLAEVSREAADVVERLARHGGGGLTAAEVRACDLLAETEQLIAAGVKARALVLNALRGTV